MSGRWRRPRTKVYDCNFNVAERYYKPVMDSLDRKHGHTSSLDPVSPLDERDSTPASRVSRLLDRESPAPSASSRANRLMAEFENGIESSHKQSRASLARDDDEADAEFEATMKKIRAARAARNVELEEEFDSIASSTRKNKISLADQLLDSVGLNSKTQRSIEEDVYSKHKRAAKKFLEEDDDNVMTKWTVMNPAAKALKDAEESAGESSATVRARKSRARLQDIDAELEELDRKSAARQKRITDLKALVAETNADSQSSGSSSMKVTKRITVKQSSEKKQVSF